MIFTDWKFIVFFAITFAVYWTIRGITWRKAWLLLCSGIFYAFWDWRFLGLIVMVVLNTYITGLLEARADGPRRRVILTVGIVLSLTVLGFFKYYGFFRTSIENMLAALDIPVAGSTLSVVLPIGISFYTFHSLSYMIDVYRGKVVATANIIDIAVYILFFPQLIAGPILRASHFLPQLAKPKVFEVIDWRSALILFLVGYFKKACISNNLVPLIDPVFANPTQYASGDAAVATLSYCMQIYCDFSGYTDMAIATAAMLGYQLPPNFAHPYFAPNIWEFWHRWHISLSSWLRDYLYIPLGGSRHGALMTARNMMVTMLLGGLWHGASWTFVFWGALHGVALVFHRAYTALGKPLPVVAGVVLTFVWVTFAWIFFRAPTFGSAIEIIASFSRPGLPVLASWQWLAVLTLSLFAAHLMTAYVKFKSAVASMNDWTFAIAYGGAVAAVLPFVNVNVVPFIYFQF